MSDNYLFDEDIGSPPNKYWKPEIGWKEMEAMPVGTEKAREYAISGLGCDGGHHKQWFLEQVLISLGVDLDVLREEMERDGFSWESGIAP